MPTNMKRVHIIGRKNSGKTTLIVELVRHLTAQGLRVGAIKHTHHAHELDTPGKDSHRHREAGSAVVGILSREMSAVFRPADAHAVGDASRYAAFAPMFADCDLVLVEGDSQADAPRVEVWREATGQDPIGAEDHSIVALISDDAAKVEMPIWKRSDLEFLAGEILRLGRMGEAE